MENQITTPDVRASGMLIPDGATIPGPIEVNGHTIIFSPIPEGNCSRLHISVIPKPAEKEAPLIYRLAYDLFLTMIRLDDTTKQLQNSNSTNSRLKDAYIKLLEEKIQLQNEVKNLQVQLGKYIEENGELRKRLERLEEMEIYSSIGAWIEEARFQILVNCGEDVEWSNFSQKWKIFVQNKANGIIITDKLKSLFGMSQGEWKRLSIDFYNERNKSSHYCPPFQEAMALLEFLPSKFTAQKNIFQKLIDGVEKLRKPEEPLDY